MSNDNTSHSPPSTDADYAQWMRDTIAHDTDAHYWSFIIQSISKPREPQEHGMDRDKWIRRSLIRACEATTSHYHGKYKSHPRYVNAVDACGVLVLPAKTTTARIRQVHAWVRIPHRFIATDGFGNTAMTSISVREKKKSKTRQVPIPVAIFHKHITDQLNTTNIWWNPQPEHLPDFGTGQTFAGLAYALRPKIGETRVWTDVEFQPAYLFGYLLSLHKAA